MESAIDCLQNERARIAHLFSMCIIAWRDETEKHYTVLSIQDVIKDIMTKVQNIIKMEALDLSPPLVKCFLDYCEWDDQHLKHRLKKFQNYYFHDVGIKYLDSNINRFKVVLKKVAKLLINYKTGVCIGCDKQVEDFTVPYCRHRVCKPCLEKTINEKVKQLQNSCIILCPANECVLSYYTILEYLKNDENDVKFQYMFISNYVENHNSLHWCPRPNCSFLIKTKNLNVIEAKCNNNHAVCLKCKNEAHAPINCEVLKKWEETLKSHNLETQENECNKCHLVTKTNMKCHFCLAVKKEKKKAKEKILTDKFYRLKYYFLCYDLEAKLQHYKDYLFNSSLDLDVIDDKSNTQTAMEVVLGYFELRNYLKYTYIFEYYLLEDDNKHVQEFREIFHMVKKIISNVNVSLMPCTDENAEVKPHLVKNKMEVVYFLVNDLKEMIQRGYNENWWTFDE